MAEKASTQEVKEIVGWERIETVEDYAAWHQEGLRQTLQKTATRYAKKRRAMKRKLG